MKIKIDNWLVMVPVAYSGYYKPFDMGTGCCLSGKALNHPIKGEKNVITSRIVSVKGANGEDTFGFNICSGKS